jgi:hypothetical protein
MTEVSARKRVPEVVDKLPIKQVLNVELRADCHPFIFKQFGPRCEIEDGPGLDPAPIKVNPIRANRHLQLFDTLLFNLKRRAASLMFASSAASLSVMAKVKNSRGVMREPSAPALSVWPL